MTEPAMGGLTPEIARLVEPFDRHNAQLVDNVHPTTWVNPEPAEGDHLVATPRNGWRHRGEHPLAGTDGVGLSLDQSIEVGLTRRCRKIVHLVVEDEADAGDQETASKRPIQGGGERHSVPLSVRY